MLVVAKFFKYHQSRKRVKESKYDQYLYSNTRISELKDSGRGKFYKKSMDIRLNTIDSQKSYQSYNCWIEKMGDCILE